MKRRLKLIVCVPALVLLAAIECSAKTTEVSSGTTNWNDAAWDNGLPTADDTVIISGDADITLTAPTHALASFLISDNATLTFSNGFDVCLTATDVAIVSNSTVTHAIQSDTDGTPGVFADWTPDSRVYFVCSNLTVLTDADISVNSRGYQGGFQTNGYGPGAGYRVGGTNASQGSAGSFGGIGETYASAPAGDPYGSVSTPTNPGSGGGGTLSSGSERTGGNGGGAVRIEATGAVTVDGDINAQGGGGKFTSGGSGGGIYISCNTFHGSGTIYAGGGGKQQTGSARGGGGRIAIDYNPAAQALVSPQPTVTFAPSGGKIAGGNPYSQLTWYQGHGTLHLADGVFWALPDLTLSGVGVEGCAPCDQRGDGYRLVIPNFTNWYPNSVVFTNITIILPEDTIIGVTNNFLISGQDARLGISNDFTVGGNLTVNEAADLIFQSGPTNSGADYGQLVMIGDTLLIGSNSYMYCGSHPTNGGSTLFQAKNLTVEDTGCIAADGRGFSGSLGPTNVGYGPGAAGPGRGGGGHGGAGTESWFGITYGDSNAPISAGSAGSASSAIAGGWGGGVVRIEALSGTVTIDGQITAYGGGGGYSVGTGAGGSVFIKAGHLAGSGDLRAGGGGGPSTAWGGGGRIAMGYRTHAWTGDPETTNVASAHVSVASGAGVGIRYGTIVWFQLPPLPDGSILQVR